mmetsp:Transcript_17133/g.19159  ORF Transcript_17133/g.19159 Transcript_17133/m.19159 type:complete len:145 (-) Transcript_17133:40-474(-)
MNTYRDKNRLLNSETEGMIKLSSRCQEIEEVVTPKYGILGNAEKEEFKDDPYFQIEESKEEILNQNHQKDNTNELVFEKFDLMDISSSQSKSESTPGFGNHAGNIFNFQSALKKPVKKISKKKRRSTRPNRKIKIGKNKREEKE